MNKYVLSFFKSADESMYIATSDDCLNFTSINNDEAVMNIEFEGKIIRDPFIFKFEDKYAMVGTTHWDTDEFLYAESTDLINWDNQKLIDLSGYNFVNVWAPEVIENNGIYYIYWSSSTSKPYDHIMYNITTTDFQQFSDVEVLFDPGYSVIDGTIIEKNNEFFLIYKDEREGIKDEKTLKIAKTTDLNIPFEIESEDYLGKAISDAWVEGPIVLYNDDTEMYYLYFDEYTRGRWGLMTSGDLVNWEYCDYGTFCLPEDVRHGGIMKLKS